MRLLFKAFARELLAHRGQSLLALTGVALGVAVVVAVALANESARRAFALSMAQVTGRATHQIVSGPAGFDEGLYRQLRLAGIRPGAPVVEGVVKVAGAPLELLGVDPFAEEGVRPQAGRLDGETLRRLLLTPGAVVMTGRTAARFGLVPGARFEVATAAGPRSAHLAGLLPAQGLDAAGLDGRALADIATAQELLGRVGRLDRIDLELTAAAQASDLRARLPPGVRLVAAESRARESLGMTAAFHTNLTAMSLLALLVGAFLVYNTAAFSVLRRRGLIGSLRVIGAGRRQILTLTLLEAALLGALGTGIGLLAGHALGRALVRLVTRTINDLYFTLTVTDFIPAPGPYLWGALLGIGVSVGAALPPALEAAGVSPLEARRRSALVAPGRRFGRRAALGTGALLFGAALLGLPGLVAGFVALFFLLLGGSLFAPALLHAIGRLATPLLARLGAVGLQAGRGLAGGLSRGGVAVAALAVAVSASVGVGVMVESFRVSVDEWLHQRLSADLYLIAPGSDGRAQWPLPPAVVERVAALPEVAGLRLGRWTEAAGPGGPLQLFALELPAGRPAGFRLIKGDPQAAWEAFRRGEQVLISEPLAERLGLRPGDRLPLESARGPHELLIGGVFQEYGSDQGLVVVERGLYRRLWEDEAISTVGLFLTAGSDPHAVAGRVRAALADLPEQPLVRATGEIRSLSMAVFDRTFLITRVLRLLAVGVAFVGVLSALMALQLERAREHAVLRATGFTPGQLFGLIGLQTGLLGLAAGLLALPLGLVMALVLIEVVNRRAFGWSMGVTLPPEALGGALLLALAAALLAGLYPAWRIARTPPALALREE